MTLPPGPWKAVKLPCEYGLAIADANKVIICSGVPEHAARIIAAAPELLEALKIYVHAHETGNSVPPKIVAEARAAIAKAEGRI